MNEQYKLNYQVIFPTTVWDNYKTTKVSIQLRKQGMSGWQDLTRQFTY